MPHYRCVKGHRSPVIQAEQTEMQQIEISPSLKHHGVPNEGHAEPSPGSKGIPSEHNSTISTSINIFNLFIII